MRIQSLVLLCLVFLLTACGPKFNYTNPRVTQPVFDHLLVVFDYLHVVDDVGKLVDYPADKNQTQMAELKALITSVLVDKGFEGTVDFALISSGLGLDPKMGFEHYVDGQLQEQLIYPPFHVESTHDDFMQQQLIRSFADAQHVAWIAVSDKSQNYFNDLRMNTLSFLPTENGLSPQPDHHAKVGVLHVRAVMPRVSFMKAMGVSLLSAGLTAGATGGAYIAIATPTGVPHSTALLFDNHSGEVIWKNQGPGDLSRFGPQAITRFFKAMQLISQK